MDHRATESASASSGHRAAEDALPADIAASDAQAKRILKELGCQQPSNCVAHSPTGVCARCDGLQGCRENTGR